MASRNVFGMLPGCCEGRSLRSYPSKFIGPMKAMNGVPIVYVVIVVLEGSIEGFCG